MGSSTPRLRRRIRACTSLVRMVGCWKKEQEQHVCAGTHTRERQDNRASKGQLTELET